MMLMACLLVVAVAGVRAAEMVQYLDENPNFPDSCYDPEARISVMVGSSSVPGRCARFICRRCAGSSSCYGQQGYQLITQTCGLMEPRPPCYPGVDRKSYPDCCMFPSC